MRRPDDEQHRVPVASGGRSPLGAAAMLEMDALPPAGGPVPGDDHGRITGRQRIDDVQVGLRGRGIDAHPTVPLDHEQLLARGRAAGHQQDRRAGRRPRAGNVQPGGGRGSNDRSSEIKVPVGPHGVMVLVSHPEGDTLILGGDKAPAVGVDAQLPGPPGEIREGNGGELFPGRKGGQAAAHRADPYFGPLLRSREDDAGGNREGRPKHPAENRDAVRVSNGTTSPRHGVADVHAHVRAPVTGEPDSDSRPGRSWCSARGRWPRLSLRKPSGPPKAEGR